MIIKGIIENKELKTAKNMQQYACFTIDKKKFNTFDALLFQNFNQGDSVEIETQKDGMYEKLIAMKKIQPEASNDKIQSPEISLFFQEILVQLKRIADSMEKK